MHMYSLIRSKRKTVSLEITREGTVLVRAPLRMPAREIERFVTAREKWIVAHLEKARARVKALPEPTDEERAAYIRRAATLLPERTEHYSRLMGVRPQGITITGARTRHGSCSPQSRICFSWRLMRYPDAAIDYVVVHELAHICYKDHGKAFYSFIASVMPDHKERRKLLK